MKGNGDEIGRKMIKKGGAGGRRGKGCLQKRRATRKWQKKMLSWRRMWKSQRVHEGRYTVKKGGGGGCDKLMVIRSDTYSREETTSERA